MVSWKLKEWLVPLSVAATVSAVAALVIGVWELFSGKNIEAANWVMAAGGLGLIVFSSVQLHREARREIERLAAARARLKPTAWLARRMCVQGVIESGAKTMAQWLVGWYASVRLRMMEGGGPPDPLGVLQQLMRETVTLAAEAGDAEVKAADKAFDAFIAAANILNDLSAMNAAGAETPAYQATIPRGRAAAQHLATAARELETLAPRGVEEPEVPANPKFMDER